MIESSMIVNDRMPEYCAERAMKILNNHKKAISNSRILVLGVAYKQDIDDYRESPAIKVIEELEKLGAQVEYYDPYVIEYKEHGTVKKGLEALDRKTVASSDLVVVTTAHTNVDYDMVADAAAMIFDTKNAMKNITNRQNIELL